ncbi:MAG: capsule assembly Wzi family protein, partial [Woeseiaceae bacterium]
MVDPAQEIPGERLATPSANIRAMHRTILLLVLVASNSFAGAYIAAGDMVLRHDIQTLSDRGIIKGPTSTWPLAWGPILNDLNNADATGLSPAVADALARVRDRANWETRTGELTFDTEVGGADNATRIRSFQDTPRGKVEVSAGLNWMDEWFSVDLNIQGVDSDEDDDEFRVDDSVLGVAFGNWSVAASTQQRWWGPGWDGSLILSNNARSFPSLTIDRVFTDAFKSKWLSWLGPWDVSVMFGQLEKERAIPN